MLGGEGTCRERKTLSGVVSSHGETVLLKKIESLTARQEIGASAKSSMSNTCWKRRSRMRKRMLRAGLVMGISVALLTHCGVYGGSSSSPPPPVPGKGGLFTFVSDQPFCDLLGFHVLITGFKLTRASGGSATILPSAVGVTSPKVELTSLRDFNTIMNDATVTAGTYTKVQITFAVLNATVYDPSQTPPSKDIIITSSTTTPTANISPPLVVTAGKISGLQMDFDLQRSFEVDSQGNLTGTFTPVITAAGITPSSTNGFGDLDDLVGFIRTVTPTSTTTGIIGGFLYQLLADTGPALEANLTDINDLYVSGTPGVPLNQLLTDSYVEMDGYVDSKGNLMVKTADVQDEEDVSADKAAHIGPVLSVTRDSNGNATQYTQFVYTFEPSSFFNVPDNTIVTVNIAPTTTFSTSFAGSPASQNFANLAFNPMTLGVGEVVVTHGVFTKSATDNSVTVAPDKIYLKPQALQGNFASLIQAGSDDHTGAFRLSSCMTLLTSTPIIVVTNSNTVFLNLAGLNELIPQPSLLVKGMAFFEPTATTVNGVSIPAGTLVVLAKQVHQLN
jgi:uncharacterized protein DUF4382